MFPALCALFAAAEGYHYAKHRHWVGYGQHVDIVFEQGAFAAEVINLTLTAQLVELCELPNDISTPQVAVSPLFDVQKYSASAGRWESMWPDMQVRCPGPAVSRTIAPLASYSTREVAIAAENLIGEGAIRFVLLTGLGPPLYSAEFSVDSRSILKSNAKPVGP